MGMFNTKIVAEYNPPRKWHLKKALSYVCTELTSDDVHTLNVCGVNIKDNTITADVDFVTDLASVPRLCWNIIAPWDIARAAIVHDLLYKRIRQYRHKFKKNQNAHIVSLAKSAADKIFLCGMKDADPKVSKWKIYSAYYAVALFGRWSIIPNETNI